MSDRAEAASAAAPQNSSADARAARRAKFEREQLIVDHLNRGVSVAEIAARIDVSEKRMRAIIREILARRMPAPPEEFVAIQVSRLNEALLVAYSAMGEMNLRAVDRVVKIVRELDRYHGFVAAERRLPEPSRIEAPVEGAMTFGAALVCRAEFPRQDAENQDGHEAQGFPIAASARDDRPGFPSQDLEKIDSAPGAAIPVAQDALRVNCAGDDGDGPTEPNNGPEIPAQVPEKMDSAPEAATPVRHHAFGLNPIRHCEDPLATT